MKKYLRTLAADIVITTGESERYVLASIRLPKSVKIREYHFSSQFKKFQGTCNWAAKFATWLDNRVLGRFFDMNYLLTKEDKAMNFKNNDKYDYMYNPCSFDIPNVLCSGRENIVVAVGRLAAEKDFSALLRIWAMIDTKGWSLRIIGDGYQRDMLEALASDLHIKDSVEFVGYCTNVASHLDKAKIVVATSKFEGFHLGLLEGMSRGCVPLSYRTPYGPADLIIDNESGILVEYENEEEFARKLEYILHDKKEIERLSTNAHKRSLEFSISKIIPQWMDIYQQLLAKKCPKA